MTKLNGYIILILIASLILIPLFFVLGAKYGKNKEKQLQKIARKTAENIMEEAIKAAEQDARFLMIEANEKIRSMEQQQQKNWDSKEFDIKQQEANAEFKLRELALKEEQIKKIADIQKDKEEQLKLTEGALKAMTVELDINRRAFEKNQTKELMKIAQLTIEEARVKIMELAQQESRKDIAKFVKEEEAKARYNIAQRAKQLLVQSMQRYTTKVATEKTVSIVNLPTDDIKGRLIGREGRNIRSIETLTGVDLIIDDTPEIIVISSFDPIRRELARLVVQELVNDGRIHPGRIEDIYRTKQEELEQSLIEYGEKTLLDMNLGSMDEGLIKLLGKLHFRTSYGQNILQHSMEVGYIASIIAAELGEDVTMAKRAGLLHDIGKAVDFEYEGSHVDLGVSIARKHQEDDIVINAIASHHGDVPATSIIAEIVAIADGISATRPGARRESLELYIKRLIDLEKLTNEFEGVDKSYAIQAGREIRVLINPDVIDDQDAQILAHDIRKKIEENMQYPGTIKITVIREVRAVDIAK